MGVPAHEEVVAAEQKKVDFAYDWLSLYEVLGAGRSSQADPRAGATRLLELNHTLPTRADGLHLVLSEPPAHEWSAPAIHDVFAVRVMWRTTAGWEGAEGNVTLGAE